MKNMNELLPHFPREIDYAGKQNLRALASAGGNAGDADPKEVNEANNSRETGGTFGAALDEIAEAHANVRASGTNGDDEDDYEEEEDDDEAAADEEMEEEDEDEEADEEADENLRPVRSRMPVQTAAACAAGDRPQDRPQAGRDGDRN